MSTTYEWVEAGLVTPALVRPSPILNSVISRVTIWRHHHARLIRVEEGGRVHVVTRDHDAGHGRALREETWVRSLLVVSGGDAP